MSVFAAAWPAGVWFDPDHLEAVALAAAVGEACAAAPGPALRFAADLLGAAAGAPCLLDAAQVAELAAALEHVRRYLAGTLSVAALPAEEQDLAVSALAVNGPVTVAARAFLWVGTLRVELDAAASRRGWGPPVS